MKIGSDLATFLTSPVMIILGTCDTHGHPDIGRGVGARVDGDTGLLEVILSAWQWPGTIANILDNGRAAITFARPNDYVTYQLKGPAQIAEPDPQALTLSARYINQITDLLCELGLERRLIADWLTQRDAALIRMTIENVFVQTPGSKAGSLIATANPQ